MEQLKYFSDFDAQEAKDLDYGGQDEACRRAATVEELGYEDPSYSGDWTPEED